MKKDKTTILVVGAGWEQTPIIKRAVERGMYVIAVDGNPEAPGLKMASYAEVVSTRDIDGVLSVARRFNIDGITYMITESPMRTIRNVAIHLGLPCPSERSANATINKSYMREIFGKHGIANPFFVCADTVKDILKKDENITYPIVVKPADSSGQQGLSLVNSSDELPLAFQKAQKNSINDEVLIEEWLQGDELNVVAVILAGKIRSIIVSNREKHQDQAFGVVQRHVYPSTLSSDQLENITKLCDDVVKALEIYNGIIFPQIIYTKNGPVMVEFGERIPGGIMKELYEYATGYDLIDIQIDIALGKIKQLDSYKTITKYPAIAVKFINCQPGPLKPGKVSVINGKDEILRMPNILAADYFVNAHMSQEIRPCRSSADRFFYIVAAGKTRAEACRNAEHAANIIDFIDHEGQSLRAC